MPKHRGPILEHQTSRRASLSDFTMENATNSQELTCSSAVRMPQPPQAMVDLGLGDMGSRGRARTSMLEQKVAKVTKRGESWVQGGGGSGREKSEAVLPMTAGESEASVQRRLGGRRPEKHVAQSCQKSAKKLPKSATFRERRERCKYPLNHDFRIRFSLKSSHKEISGRE